MLFSSYRLDQYADPEGFAAQAAVVLGQYPANVVERVTSPLTGIQIKQQWPPTIFELQRACEGAAAVFKAEAIIAQKAARGLFWDGQRFAPRAGHWSEIASHNGAKTVGTSAAFTAPACGEQGSEQ